MFFSISVQPSLLKSHIELFWKITQPVYFYKHKHLQFQTTPTPESQNSTPHEKETVAVDPRVNYSTRFTLTWKWQNYWILQPSESHCLPMLSPFRPLLVSTVWYAIPEPWLLTQSFFHLSILSFLALWLWRVVLAHATLIISHSDIQIATEKHHSHMCSRRPEYIKGQLAWKWPLVFPFFVKLEIIMARCEA